MIFCWELENIVILSKVICICFEVYLMVLLMIKSKLSIGLIYFLYKGFLENWFFEFVLIRLKDKC